jgi:Trk K+ transport system NAD-binding subunit
LSDIRHVHLLNAYPLGRGFAEIWELKLKEDSLLEGKKIQDITLPEKCKIVGIERGKKLLFPQSDTTLELNDVLVVIVSPNGINKAERALKI